MSKVIFRAFSLLVLAVMAVGVWLLPVLASGQGWGAPTGAPLKVAFLDVGQGDAIFIETPDGVQVLIDGGAGSAVLRELAKHMSVGDRSIDVVIATHFDKDHIGGLVDVLGRYEVDHVIKTNNKNDTVVTKAFELALADSEVHLASAGQQLMLGASTSILILSPAGDASLWESNTASIVAQLRYGEIEFMLTGDAPLSIEDYLARTWGETLESEVLKLGHHGSRTSTSDLFLETVKPDYGMVSAGRNNSYGHPHAEVTAKLKNRNIEMLSTADRGTVVFKSDGEMVWVE